MMVYALYDKCIDDLWAVDGTVVTTTNPDKIAMFWLNFEREEPGRYEIISGEMCE